MRNARRIIEDDRNGDAFTALMTAAEKGRGAMARFLIERGADPSLRTSSGETAAGFAERAGYLQIAELLRRGK